MLSVSSSTALHPVKDTLTESRSAIQESGSSDFRKLLAAEMGDDSEAPETGASDPQVDQAADANGNSPGIPGNPSLKDSEDMDAEAEAEEDPRGKEGSMTAEMLAGGFQLSHFATATAIPGITDALHLPGTSRTLDTVTGIETRIPAGRAVQQQPNAAFDQRSANALHRSAAGRIISPASSIEHEAQAGGDAKSSELSGLGPGEAIVSVAQVMEAGMHPNSAIAGDSQEGRTAVRIASSRLVSAPVVAVREMSHSDSVFSESKLAGIPSSIGDFLPDVAPLRPGSAAGSDPSSLPTFTAPVVPHELLTPSPSPGHLIVEPGAVTGIADSGDPSLLRLEPRVGTGGWDNALSQRMLWMVSNQHQIAALNLNPPDLGPLQVILSVNSDQASAAFVSQNPEVRQALEAALPRLKEMMADSGINLGNATVSDQESRQQQGDLERQNRGRSHYRQEESGITPAGTNLGMSRGTADIRGPRLVDTFV